jgi:hypothetical protein
MGSTGNSTLWGQLIPGGTSGGQNAVPVLVSDILYRAARLCNLIGAPQRGLSEGEEADLFNWLNDMIDSWNTERLTVTVIARTEWPITPGQGDYEIGPTGADWVGPRPERIEKASMITLANPAQPMELEIPILNYEQWQSVRVKQLTSTLIQAIYYEAFNAAGNGIVHVWPIPTVPNPIALYTWQSLTQFVSVDDQVLVPPGYFQALYYNLAVLISELFPEQKRVVLKPSVIAKAAELKKNIKRINFPKLLIRCDSLLSNHGYYNIYTDGFAGKVG